VVGLMRAGDLLVLNDTRVTALRVFGKKPSGGGVELLLLKDLGEHRYEALARPGKRLPAGAVVELEDGLKAVVEETLPDGRKILQLKGSDPVKVLERIGLAPLPPYVKTPLRDRERYQTVYASAGGSAAAPTAGLHFTPALLDELRERGVGTAHVTLDVGLDTFRPITSENPFDHEMHGERCSVPMQTGEAIAACTGRIIAVGTTSTRTLESFATGPRRVESGERTTKIFIKPGYRFQIIDGMFTNFHMPRTTMLMMLSAFAGAETVARAYREALAGDYRFLSLGDSMLIL
jgi:S-adenosylmethionine:tRNA ribosyltransferase-isomerase